MTLFVDFIPSGFRAAARARRRARLWISAYGTAALCIAASYAAVSTGRSQAQATRMELDRQLQHEWDRNKEAQRLLAEIQSIEEAITRFDRLASPVRTVDVLGTIGALLPESAALTALTLVPRNEKLAIKPVPGAAGNPKPTSKTVHYLAVEVEGVVPNDAELASLVSALEGCPLFASVGMDFARSTTIDATPARAFRVSARVDFGRLYSFAPPASETVAPASAAANSTPSVDLASEEGTP